MDNNFMGLRITPLIYNTGIHQNFSALKCPSLTECIMFLINETVYGLQQNCGQFCSFQHKKLIPVAVGDTQEKKSYLHLPLACGHNATPFPGKEHTVQCQRENQQEFEDMIKLRLKNFQRYFVYPDTECKQPYVDISQLQKPP